MKKHSRNNGQQGKTNIRRFQKSLVSYVLMLLFFGFLFLRVGVPSFVFFIVAIPMTISIIHKYIDVYHSENESIEEDIDIYNDSVDYEDEDGEEESLDLEEFKSLRKEWKDSDFV